MACMCGDPYCWSCGPAQGNYKCQNCGKWSMDGGCDNPQQCEDVIRMADAELDRMEREADLSDAYMNDVRFGGTLDETG